jgi:hypothetical protein
VQEQQQQVHQQQRQQQQQEADGNKQHAYLPGVLQGAVGSGDRGVQCQMVGVGGSTSWGDLTRGAYPAATAEAVWGNSSTTAAAAADASWGGPSRRRSRRRDEQC